MNFSFYFYGNPNKRYSQYPDDYTASTLADLQEGVTGARLVIYRKMDLIHYAYTESLGNKNNIGFCIIFNKSYCKRPHRLANLFRTLIETRLIESGEIIRYSDKGVLEYQVNTLTNSSREHEQLQEVINAELETNYDFYGIDTVTSTYNGEKTTAEVVSELTDAQIIDLTRQHNKVVVNYHNGVDEGYIPKVIETLRTSLLQAEGDVERLKKENTKLNKQKKQYRYVMLLSLLLVGCGLGILSLNNNLTSTKDELAQAIQTISDQQDSITEKNSLIIKLNQDTQFLTDKLQSEVSRREEIETEFTSLKNGFGQPLFIMGSSFNFNSGNLSFTYFGIQETTLKLYVRAYRNNENYYNSGQVNIKKGTNTSSIFLSRGLDSNKYYSFEILVDDTIIIGGGRH